MGGAHALENLVSLCRFHHRRHHKGEFGITKTGPNSFRFTTQNGAEIVARRLSVDRLSGGAEHLRSAAHARGIQITPYTPVARDGADFNLNWATSVIADGCEYIRSHGSHPGLAVAPT